MTTKYYISWEEFHQDTLLLSTKISATNKEFKGIIVVTRGGLVPAAIISQQLNLRVIEAFSVSSYNGAEQGELRPLTIPHLAMQDNGEGWLMIDELEDSGKTIEFARNLLPHAVIVTVYRKPVGAVQLSDMNVKEFGANEWLIFPWEQYS